MLILSSNHRVKMDLEVVFFVKKFNWLLLTGFVAPFWRHFFKCIFKNLGTFSNSGEKDHQQYFKWIWLDFHFSNLKWIFKLFSFDLYICNNYDDFFPFLDNFDHLTSNHRLNLVVFLCQKNKIGGFSEALLSLFNRFLSSVFLTIWVHFQIQAKKVSKIF